MRIRSKKGFALAYTMYFVMLAAIASIGVYSHAYYLSKEAQIQKPASLRGYYAAIAAERYAAILLKNPTAEPLAFTDEAFNGESRSVPIPSELKQALELKDNESLTVTVTEVADNYEIDASFTS